MAGEEVSGPAGPKVLRFLYFAGAGCKFLRFITFLLCLQILFSPIYLSFHSMCYQLSSPSR